MAPITSSVIPLLALLLGSTASVTAFVAPTSRSGAVWSVQQHQRARASSSITTARPTTGRRPLSSIRMVDEVAQEKAAKLRETAAAFRAQAAELENKREQERRVGADRSFNTFDSNRDGAVDATELKAGLEGPLRRSFTKQLTARMGRKPNQEEVDAQIAKLPGGTLFPDDLALKLIATYDSNGDGLLQQSEFAPTEELSTRLENMFRDQREEERQVRVEERQRLMGEKNADKVAVATGDLNDGPATAADKALSALPYLLPLADSITFAAHIFGTFPEQTAWAQPFAVVLLALRSIPFATLVSFFSLSILSSNPKVNKLVRFNMLQAINLDIALVVPGVLGAISTVSLGRDAYKLAPLSQVGSDVVFVTMLAVVVYSIATSATGEFPNKLPLLGRINRENPDKEDN